MLVLARARCCALETCGKKKMRALLLGLAKSIYLSLKIVGQKNLEKKKKKINK